MNTEFDNKQPIYQQIIDRIMLEIAKGELAPGSKVSPVREFAADFKVNPNTMQKALSKLEEMGYMYTERTSGRYVTQDATLIESLKASLPTEITAKYVREMEDHGISSETIPAYVAEYISKRKDANNG